MRRLRDESQQMALLPSPLPGLRSRIQMVEKAPMITFTIDLWFLTLLIGLTIGYLIGHFSRGRR